MQTAVSTFVFGLASSVHCAGMCGPLAACFAGGPGALTAYHTARVLAYGGAGAVLGALGGAIAPPSATASAWLSLALGAVLVAGALGFGARLGQVPGLGGALTRASAWSMRRAPTTRAAVLGAVTPLLPCGLLYVVAGSALVAGSTLGGASVSGAFALGSLPALGFAQWNVGWLRSHLEARQRALLQRALFLAAAAVLLVRGWLALGGQPGCCAH